MTAATLLPDRMTIAELDFTVRLSGQRRTVGITVDRDGSLLLLAPAGSDVDQIAAWAHSKRGWVYRKLAEKDLLLSTRPTKDFVTGEGFDYLGRHHRLLLADDPDGRVKLERGRLRMPRATARAGDGPAAVIRWYRDRALAWLPRRAKPWAARLDAQPAGLDVRDLGYRWGSLGRGDRLNIHWATMQLPVSLVDYVLVHELAHITEAHHTPTFWAIVERALPDYEARKSRLATTGAGLWLG
jgi:predicted metal-dependent hydrolase